MKSAIPSTPPPPSSALASLQHHREQAHHINDNNAPLPSTLILTPLRNTEENLIVISPSSTTPASIPAAAGGQTRQQQQQHHRPVLTLPCYPTIGISIGSKTATASAISSTITQRLRIAPINNGPSPRTKLGPESNNGHTCPNKLYLGRNETTLITDSNLSRNIGTITCNFDEFSYTFEFRLTVIRKGMISLNEHKHVSNRGSGSSSRKKFSDRIGGSGAILKPGDVISLHDAQYEKQYRYRVDIMTPEYEERDGEEEKNEAQPKMLIKEDSAVGSSDTMVDHLQLKQPKPDCDAGSDCDDSDKSSSSTASTTVPETDERSETKQVYDIKQAPAIKDDTEIKDDPDDANSSTTRSSSSSSSTLAKVKLQTPLQKNQQFIERQKLELLQIQQLQHSKDIEQQQLTARKHTLDELTCSICMEILVRTHVSHPCGHLFCGPCIEKYSEDTDGPSHPIFLTFQPPPRVRLKSCPTCRMEMSNCTLTRSYDNVIWNMVLMGSVFSGVEAKDDLKQFLVRSGREISGLSSVELDCIFGKSPPRGRRRGLCDGDGRDGGDDMDEDECRIVKRVRTNPTWQPTALPHLQGNGILDLTEPLILDIAHGSNMDDPIIL